MTLDRVRVIGFVVIALAAIAVVFAMEPESSGAETRAAVAGALVDAELNESGADSAPQQQVVNGWVARDLLTAIANAQADDLDREPDPRLPVLAALVVLAVCWLGVIRPVSRRTPVTSTTDDG